MRNPFLQSRQGISVYIAVWAVIMIAHTAMLWFMYTVPPGLAAADALISNLSFAALSLSFWYTVRFSSIDTGAPYMLVFNHIVAALIFLTVWHYGSYLLLRWIGAEDISYLAFLESSAVWRCLIGILYCFILVLIYYVYLYYTSVQKKIQREGTLQSLVKEGELSLLKSQLQPHFIFNSLNSIHSLSISDPEAARTMLLNLSSFLRLSMEKDMEKTVSLQEEIEHAMLYLDIEKVRFGKRLLIVKNLQEQTYSKRIPHLLLQPLIENAVKHGLHQHTGTVTIQIEALTKGEDLLIRVSNNYDSHERKLHGTGIGLPNVHRRLTLMYNRKDLMQITNENSIFLIELTIPQY